MQIADELVAELLARWPVGRLATLNAAGRPHVVPVVFCALDGVVYSPVDDKRKTGTRLKRFDNVTAQPRASLLLDAYTDDWESLWWVRLDGVADELVADGALGARVAQRLLAKYPQYGTGTFRFDATTFLRLRPDSVRAWSQSGSPAVIRTALKGA